MSDIDIKHLARLARIRLTPDEEKTLASQMESILTYVGEIQNAPVDLEGEPEKADLRNVLREDTDAYERDTFKDTLLREVPDTENGYVKVKKIL